MEKSFAPIASVRPQNQSALPIFDGGICAQNDVLLLSYTDSAEYIRIGKSSAHTRLQLWDANTSRVNSAAAPKKQSNTGKPKGKPITDKAKGQQLA